MFILHRYADITYADIAYARRLVRVQFRKQSMMLDNHGCQIVTVFHGSTGPHTKHRDDLMHQHEARDFIHQLGSNSIQVQEQGEARNDGKHHERKCR